MKIRLLLLMSALTAVVSTYAQDSTKEKSLEIYGFAMTDFGYNFDQINPAWFDALRVTKLPVSKNQYRHERKHLLQRKADPVWCKGLYAHPTW